MREEAAEVRDTLPDIESWAEKLQLLAEEVHSFLCQTTLTCARSFVGSTWRHIKTLILINKRVGYCPVCSSCLLCGRSFKIP